MSEKRSGKKIEERERERGWEQKERDEEGGCGYSELIKKERDGHTHTYSKTEANGEVKIKDPICIYISM